MRGFTEVFFFFFFLGGGVHHNCSKFLEVDIINLPMMVNYLGHFSNLFLRYQGNLLKVTT